MLMWVIEQFGGLADGVLRGGRCAVGPDFDGLCELVVIGGLAEDGRLLQCVIHFSNGKNRVVGCRRAADIVAMRRRARVTCAD